jgi:hypothetical protein
MHRVVKLTARAPGVSESSTIDTIVGGLRVRNCQDVLDRIKPKSLQELFEVMQEYCKSDKGRHRRLDRANAAKKQKQQGQWDQPKGWQTHPLKQAPHQGNMDQLPPTKTRIETAVGTKEDTKTEEGRSHNNHILHSGGGGDERFLCWLHGIDAHHHTHQCPLVIKKKLEWEAEEKAKAAGLAVKHATKCQNTG